VQLSLLFVLIDVCAKIVNLNISTIIDKICFVKCYDATEHQIPVQRQMDIEEIKIETIRITCCTSRNNMNKCEYSIFTILQSRHNHTCENTR